MNSRPTFRYHPDPIQTGRVRADRVACAACGKARGLVFDLWGPEGRDGGLRVYPVCPACIADGGAYRRLGVPFCGAEILGVLRAAGVGAAAIEEVRCRTPGVNSAQGDLWVACCGDCCAFLGDASRDELALIDGDELERVQAAFAIGPRAWPAFLDAYEPGGDPRALKFVCTRCGLRRYCLDGS